MLSRFVLALLLLPRVSPELPARSPADFLLYGCSVAQSCESRVDPQTKQTYCAPLNRWPNMVWVDIRGVPPDPDCELTPKHSWCDLHSMYTTRKRAMKDCDDWMNRVQKILRKAQPR